eukprot:366229-Chlamydomonas_euryale.AAC.61
MPPLQAPLPDWSLGACTIAWWPIITEPAACRSCMCCTGRSDLLRRPAGCRLHCAPPAGLRWDGRSQACWLLRAVRLFGRRSTHWQQAGSGRPSFFQVVSAVVSMAHMAKC